MSNTKSNDSFESYMEQIEKVITELERGDLSLDKSFEKYKEGMDLLAKCNASVEKVEKELQILESEGI